MTFSIVQAARRLSGIFILALLFGEAFPQSMAIGSCLAAIGFAGHAWATTVQQRNHHPLNERSSGKADRNYELVSLTPPTEANSSLDEEDESLSTKSGTSLALCGTRES